MRQAITILAFIENTTPWSAGRKFFMDYPFLNMQEKVVYFICNSATVEPIKEGQDWWSAYLW